MVGSFCTHPVPFLGTRTKRNYFVVCVSRACGCVLFARKLKKDPNSAKPSKSHKS